MLASVSCLHIVEDLPVYKLSDYVVKAAATDLIAVLTEQTFT